MALLALQPDGCGLARARNREFQATGTGTYQAISERIRELSGGRKRGARPGAAGLQNVAGIPFPRAWNYRMHTSLAATALPEERLPAANAIPSPRSGEGGAVGRPEGRPSFDGLWRRMGCGPPPPTALDLRDRHSQPHTEPPCLPHPIRPLSGHLPQPSWGRGCPACAASRTMPASRSARERGRPTPPFTRTRSRPPRPSAAWRNRC